MPGCPCNVSVPLLKALRKGLSNPRLIWSAPIINVWGGGVPTKLQGQAMRKATHRPPFVPKSGKSPAAPKRTRVISARCQQQPLPGSATSQTGIFLASCLFSSLLLSSPKSRICPKRACTRAHTLFCQGCVCPECRAVGCCHPEPNAAPSAVPASQRPLCPSLLPSTSPLI